MGTVQRVTIIKPAEIVSSARETTRLCNVSRIDSILITSARLAAHRGACKTSIIEVFCSQGYGMTNLILEIVWFIVSGCLFRVLWTEPALNTVVTSMRTKREPLGPKLLASYL